MTKEEALQILDTIPTIGEQVDALEMAIKALSQEPYRDIKEIAEIIECDADAEIKCKMISNILTAKPHYFEVSQEPTEKPMTVDEMEREYEKSKALFHKIVECDDAIDRAEAMTEIMMFAGNVKPDEEDIYIKVSDAVQLLRELPSVTQKSGVWRHYENMLTCSQCKAEFYDEIMEYCGDDVPRFCPNCGAKMESGE